MAQKKTTFKYHLIQTVWHVNYHRKAIRDNLKSNVHHEEQLAYAKSKAKE